ncbi:MAG: helix-turn-helix transcriptional regulator [Deltaproteobacteria bacterium]|nr:helix-turn-helix transcriptional regulator [Deltaproteobacteria bacterium]
MLELTRESTTTNYVEIRFRIPIEKLQEVRQAMASIGAEEEVSSVPWEEVYPDFNARIALRGARKKEGLSQKELARLAGMKQAHISEMENGKRPIGKELAKRLSKVLKVDYRVFL